MKKIIISLAAACLLAVGALAADTTPILQFRLIAEKPGADSEQMTMVTKNKDNSVTNFFNVEKTVLLDEAALKSASVSTDALGHAVIGITFSETGTVQLATVTRRNIGRQLGIVIDGTLYSAPRINSAIEGGKAQISGSFSKTGAKDLAKRINSAITK